MELCLCKHSSPLSDYKLGSYKTEEAAKKVIEDFTFWRTVGHS